MPLNRVALPNSNPIVGTDTLCYILSLLQVSQMSIPLVADNFTKSSSKTATRLSCLNDLRADSSLCWQIIGICYHS